MLQEQPNHPLLCAIGVGHFHLESRDTLREVSV